MLDYESSDFKDEMLKIVPRKLETKFMTEAFMV